MTPRRWNLFIALLLLPAWASSQQPEVYSARANEAILEVSKQYAIAVPLGDTVSLGKLKELSAAIDTGRDGRQFTASSLATPLATVIDQPTTTNFVSLALENRGARQDRGQQRPDADDVAVCDQASFQLDPLALPGRTRRPESPVFHGLDDLRQGDDGFVQFFQPRPSMDGSISDWQPRSPGLLH